MTRLLQVVPRLPPSLDGVGAYAAALGTALIAHGIAVHYLATDRAAALAAGTPGAGGPPAALLDAPRAAALARQLAASGAATVLVHYVNYAYQRRGCPRWLVRGAAAWRRGAPGRRLVTVFHEVYATGPPWRSSFWTFPLQRRLAVRLLAASDAAVTTAELYRALLVRLARRPAATPVHLAPVFSTAGEPETVTAPAARRPRVLVVFGGPGTRRRAYRQLAGPLAAACRGLAIEQVLDIGPPIAGLPAAVAGAPLRALGALPAERLSDQLARAYAGFVAYPAALLAKSSVHAAYCAHGLVPVCCWPGGGPRSAGWNDSCDVPEGEQTGGPAPVLPDSANAANASNTANAAPPPFWDPAADLPPGGPEALAAQALAWYAGHRLAVQAAWYRDLIAGRPG